MRNLKQTIALMAALCLVVGMMIVPGSAATLADFTDVPEGHWAENVLEEAVRLGILGGFPDGTLRPNDNVTRAQLVSMIDKGFGFDVEGAEISFTDVPEEHWVFYALARAVALGYVEDGEAFLPSQEFTREEVFVMIAKVAGLTPVEEDHLARFVDYEEIAEENVALVNAAVAARLVRGHDVGTLEPAGKLTRAQAAAFVVRTLEYMGVGTGMATVEVTVGGMNFKSIEVTETDVVGAYGFMVCEFENVIPIGESFTRMISADQVMLYIVAENGMVLATGILDVSATATVEVVLQLEPTEDPVAVLTVALGGMNFKSITVESVNVAAVVGFKVTGFDTVTAVGGTFTRMISADTVELELVDADGAVVGSYTIDFDMTYDATEVELN